MIKIKTDTILIKPTDELIVSEEKFYRVKFPLSYLDFIKINNGSVPVTNLFEVENKEIVLERFVCFLGEIKEGHQYGWLDIGVIIEPIYERLTDNSDLHGLQIIPIGILFAGDLLCFDFRKNKENPQVCIWYHEESNDFKPVTQEVADCFEQFLDMLY